MPVSERKSLKREVTATVLTERVVQQRMELEKEANNIHIHMAGLLKLTKAIEAIPVQTTPVFRRLAIKRLIRTRDLTRTLQRVRGDTERYEKQVAPYVSAYGVCSEHSFKRRAIDPLPTPGGGNGQRHGLRHYVDVHQTNRQGAVLQEYLMSIGTDVPQVRIKSDDQCRYCNVAMVLVLRKSVLACPRCGTSVPFIDYTTATMNYGDEMEFPTFTYKRINHFNEWLNQLQAREVMEVPLSSIEAVMEQLYRQRYTPARSISVATVRGILTALHLRKAYEHVVQVWCRITGYAPHRLPPELEEQCRLMFIAIQKPFEDSRPAERKNFLSYSYTLYKFFQILGCDEFLEGFALLKGADKLAKQDAIFKRICASLDWEFIPSTPTIGSTHRRA